MKRLLIATLLISATAAAEEYTTGMVEKMIDGEMDRVSEVDINKCMGCGTCAAARPEFVRMADTAAHGRRPVVADEVPTIAARELVGVCPGRAIDAAPPASESGKDYSHAAWGPVLEVWEGHATDPELRFKGSSGGVVSALALFCIEQKDYAGAVQVRARDDQPLLN